MADQWRDILSSYEIDVSAYESLYKSLHSNPNLSLQETFAASTVAEHLIKLNSSLSDDCKFTIHKDIGGYGLAAVMFNGEQGPTVLLRADMDALPIEEKTGLEYASKKREVDKADGIEKPVMHACGHDFHVTALLAAAEILAHTQSKWAGTLILLFQPNEERGAGAKAMVDDGLYEKVPKPDIVLGQHVQPERSGRVLVRAGTMMAAADSFKITLFGRGGHGSLPQNCIDPVVLGANVVVRLQSIVAREVAPSETAVVTIGSIQAGDTENVIADKAVLRVNVRSQSESTRKRVLRSIERIVKAECQASGCIQEPLIETTTRFPLTINDSQVTARIQESFGDFFGPEFFPDRPINNASEDVSVLATSVGAQHCFWFFGGTGPELWDRAEREERLIEDIPTNHSAFFAPVIQPTLRIGTEALCVGALTFLTGGSHSPNTRPMVTLPSEAL